MLRNYLAAPRPDGRWVVYDPLGEQVEGFVYDHRDDAEDFVRVLETWQKRRVRRQLLKKANSRQ
jgi:hypothetical protein